MSAAVAYQPIELELVPAGVGAAGQRFAALVEGRLLCRARAPLYAAARVLLAAGVDPAAALQARHQGSRIVAMRSTVGEAARWSIAEREHGGLRRRPWVPRDDAVSGYQGATENGLDGGEAG